MNMTEERRAELETEIEAFMARYNTAFVSGTREDLQALVHLPVIYVSETEAQVRERYPFDPERMREATGFHHPETRTRIVHLEETRAHLTIEGTRHREDGSVIESIDSFYILHKRDGEWGVSVFSGIRGAR
ncbi:MAG TPA: hypothetical protein EYG17_11770 [Acidimicrobiia bacterium]|jgi:hypothetical protein|nr:hypothetical protein [Acidimicrobiia bacterium]HIL06711.1 hypothetical protein [Acidimicrobiia bacterium]